MTSNHTPTGGAPIVVLGASGRLGRALTERIGHGRTVPAARRVPGPGWLQIGRDGLCGGAALEGAGAVINCVGRATGNEAELMAVNADLPEKLARQARDAGVTRFVHVSSFSVFGRERLIDATKVTTPISAYGRSKLEGERRLRALRSPDFATTSVRLPFMFSRDHPAQMASLIALLTRLPAFPIPRPGPMRSMITFPGAAQVLAALAEEAGPEECNAADPQPFTYALLAQLLASHGRRVRLVGLPKVLFAPVSAILPGLMASVYGDSLLDPGANAAEGMALERPLDAEIAALIGGLPSTAASPGLDTVGSER